MSFSDTPKPNRRLLLAALSACLLPPRAMAAAKAAIGKPAGIRLGPARDFSFAALAARAKKNASQPYNAPQLRATQIIKGIDFDAAQKIKFRAEHALWAGGPNPDPVAFFHLSRYSGDPVVLHAVEGGKAREILYGPDYFDYSTSGLDAKALGNLGSQSKQIDSHVAFISQLTDVLTSGVGNLIRTATNFGGAIVSGAVFSASANSGNDASVRHAVSPSPFASDCPFSRPSAIQLRMSSAQIGPYSFVSPPIT